MFKGVESWGFPLTLDGSGEAIPEFLIITMIFE
jgi:hypothetical protein